MTTSTPPGALVAVLGDLGRSPRMLNHARMLLARGWRVTLAGFRETPLPDDLAANPMMELLAVALPAEARGATRLRAQWRLARLIAKTNPTWKLAIVQNPPAFPVLAALRRAQAGRTHVVIDWHNLGHTLLAQAGRGRLFGALYRSLERHYARRGDRHWAVSSALGTEIGNWLGASEVTVLRDQPPAGFVTAAKRPADRSAWWRRHLPDISPPPESARWVAMPSSWTPDENVGLLLDTARQIARGDVRWPEDGSVTVVATGQGAGRAAFARAFPASDRISLRTGWLPVTAYAELLAGADAGLCLHASSSGLDLPMKLADMRGAGLPALVFDYGEVLREVFEAGAQGGKFRTPQELAALLAGVAAAAPPRNRGHAETWEESWQAVVRQIRALEAGRPD